MNKPVSLYIHIPWCLRKCPYCDFNSYGTAADRIPKEKYFETLMANFNAMADLYNPAELKTVFIGGGTPSLLDPEFFINLFNGIEQRVHINSDAEITMEINPKTADRKKLESLSRIINRISFGVQSLSDRFLKSIRRIHNAEEAESIVRNARSLKFDNINLDIMYGLPNQTLSDCLKDLEKAISLNPDHISWYELTVEDDTEFGRNPPENLPDSDLLADMSEAGIELLKKEGYERYEISNYCRDGKKCRHNLTYWNFEDYMGIGAGAHGKFSDQKEKQIYRIAQPDNPATFMKIQNFLENRIPVQKDSIPFQYFLNRARLMNDRFSLNTITETTFLTREDLTETLKPLEKKLYIEKISDDEYRITKKGYTFNNEMLVELLPD
jgi:oxygen-independent coproporphyrinogen-3 oxidase